MSSSKGNYCRCTGNLTVEFEGIIRQNEVVYLSTGGKNLKGEVIEIDGKKAKVQIFEPTRGVKCGDAVEFTSELLSVELGPGLLQNVYDGLQNPLEKIAEENGYFLPRGVYLAPLDQSKKWDFTPIAKAGDTVSAASYLGRVPEAVIDHKIMVPFGFTALLKYRNSAGSYTINEVIAKLQDDSGKNN